MLVNDADILTLANDIVNNLFFFSSSKEFCQTDDCRSGDCELLHFPNGLMRKSCHCPKVNSTSWLQLLLIFFLKINLPMSFLFLFHLSGCVR